MLRTMESCSFHAITPLIFPNKISNSYQTISCSSFLPTKKLHHQNTILLLSNTSTQLHATLKSPKGFGTPKKKTNSDNKKPNKDDNNDNDDDDEEEEDDDREQGVIPEIVTNRMMNRMGLSVGIPLFTGLAFFPFFYYLKVGLKIDVPTWVPFIVSFVFFGTALLGVSYGIVSTSWDPLREGSFWGWNEAQKNWPVFWQSLRNGGTSSSPSKK